MIFSYFLIPIILIILRNLNLFLYKELNNNIFYIWLFLFFISFIGIILLLSEINKKTKEIDMNKRKIKIKDREYNLKIFEYWFLIISPCIIFTGRDMISVIGILMMFLIIGLLLYRQNIISLNIILILFGYNFYLIEYEGKENILCTKKNISKLKSSLHDESVLYRIKINNYLYI